MYVDRAADISSPKKKNVQGDFYSPISTFQITSIGYFNPEVEVTGDDSAVTVGSDVHYKDGGRFLGLRDSQR